MQVWAPSPLLLNFSEKFGEAVRAAGQTLGNVASVFSLRLTVSTKTSTALKAPRV